MREFLREPWYWIGWTIRYKWRWIVHPVGWSLALYIVLDWVGVA